MFFPYIHHFPMRHIEGRLWKFRPGDNRLFYFLQLERKFVILFGYRKKT